MISETDDVNGMDLVPNAELRAAVERSGLTCAEIARAVGWIRPDGKENTTSLRRALGIQANGQPGCYNKRLPYRRAVAIVRAIGRAPHEFGW